MISQLSTSANFCILLVSCNQIWFTHASMHTTSNAEHESFTKSSVMQESDCALVGATVAPGFEYADFELGDRAELLRQYPQHQHVIKRLLPDQ